MVVEVELHVVFLDPEDSENERIVQTRNDEATNSFLVPVND